MNHFSRLSEIVTCNLSEILARCDNPQTAMNQILREMEEGLQGAHRCVASAIAAEEKLAGELASHRQNIAHWSSQAKDHLLRGEEDAARQAIQRKLEVDALIAGLEQQLQAATSTRTHLETTQRAIQARIAEAQRKLSGLENPGELSQDAAPVRSSAVLNQPEPTEADRVEQEFQALKRELQQGT